MSILPQIDKQASQGSEKIRLLTDDDYERYESYELYENHEHYKHNGISGKFVNKCKLSKEGTRTSTTSSTSSSHADISRHHLLAVFRAARRCRTDYEDIPNTEQLIDIWRSSSKLSEIELSEFVPIFTESWHMVRHKIGEGPLAEYIKIARQRQIPASLEVFGDCHLTVIARLCQVLGERGAEPFPLSSTALSEELGRSQVSISRALRYLVDIKFIERTSQGKIGVASKYRYVQEFKF